MKLVSPETRILIGFYALGMSTYLTLFTEKDYGLWIALAGSMLAAGIAKVFSSRKE
jgi:hypothetical protein